MKLLATIKFIITNYDIILQGLFTIVTSLVAIIEVINRLIPTKIPDSFITRLGNFLVKLGENIKKAIDFLKIPNNIKK